MKFQSPGEDSLLADAPRRTGFVNLDDGFRPLARIHLWLTVECPDTVTWSDGRFQAPWGE